MTHSIRHKRKAGFLSAFSECGNVTLACKMAGIGRKTHYRWLEADHRYAEAFREAEQAATDYLEAEAWRRAVEGVEKPAGWYKGKAGGSVREYSDTLLIFLLKGLRPDKYRERYQVTHNVVTWDDIVHQLEAEERAIDVTPDAGSDQVPST